MSRTGKGSGGNAFVALLEDSAEELYENAPCGYLSTMLDGTIAKINATLLGWLGLKRAAVVGQLRFTDLLTVGGKLYHETHFAPTLRMTGSINGVALELRTADGERMPVLVSSVLRYGEAGEPLLIRTTVFDGRERRAYEQELLRARRAAEQATQDAEQAAREAEQAAQEADQAAREAAEAARNAELAAQEADQALRLAEQATREAEKATREAEKATREAEKAEREAKADRARLQAALAVLQQSLLPATLPDVPGMRAAAYYHAASPDQLGGDFYDVFAVDGERWAFFLGDVCGKGPEAAAMTSLTRHTLRAAALHDPGPVSALHTLNTVLFERYTHGDPRYCTAIFGLLIPDPGTGGIAVNLASGGHPPALVLRADGTCEFLSTPGGMLVGILPQPHFAPADTVLAPGDILLMYTDGLTEARTGRGYDTLFGDEALREFVAGLSGATPRTLIEALTELVKSFGDGLDDDTALLALGVPNAPAQAQAAE